MAKQSINIGSVPNDGTGNTLREGGDLINDNFNEIYTAIGDGTTLTSGTFLTTSNSETVINKTINGPDNTITNIANASLSNSTINIQGSDSTQDTISLGETLVIDGTLSSSISGNTLTLNAFNGGSDLDQDNATIQDVGYISYRSSSNTPTKTLTV